MGTVHSTGGPRRRLGHAMLASSSQSRSKDRLSRSGGPATSSRRPDAVPADNPFTVVPDVRVVDVSLQHDLEGGPPETGSEPHGENRAKALVEVAREASEAAFGLGECPVTLHQPLPQPLGSANRYLSPTGVGFPVGRRRCASVGDGSVPDESAGIGNEDVPSGGGDDARRWSGVHDDCDGGDGKVPCVFRWTPRSSVALMRAQGPQDQPGVHLRQDGPVLTVRRPKEVMVCGSFNDWQPVRMAAPSPPKTSGRLSGSSSTTSSSAFVAVFNLPLGRHQFKYLVDGEWRHDPTQPTVDDGLGGFNNQVEVAASDRNAFDALDVDFRQSRRHRNSPPEFGQEVPRGGGQPPVLPPHLLQVILNKETPVTCEPTLLPAPNHVMVNHLYALSIRDNVFTMCTTSRYRKKFVTTVFYKPFSLDKAADDEHGQ